MIDGWSSRTRSYEPLLGISPHFNVVDRAGWLRVCRPSNTGNTKGHSEQSPFLNLFWRGNFCLFLLNLAGDLSMAAPKEQARFGSRFLSKAVANDTFVTRVATCVVAP